MALSPWLLAPAANERGAIMRNYKELRVWERAHALTLDVYRATAGFPKQELFGLTSQMRRCATSIGTNLAEGCGRRSNPEMARFLQFAMGSASELDYELLLSRDLHFLALAEYESLQKGLTEVRRMLTALYQTVKLECEPIGSRRGPRAVEAKR